MSGSRGISVSLIAFLSLLPQSGPCCLVLWIFIMSSVNKYNSGRCEERYFSIWLIYNLKQTTWVHTCKPPFKIIFNIILQWTLRSSKWPFPSGFWGKILYAFRFRYRFFWDATLPHWVFGCRRLNTAFCPHLKVYVDLNHNRYNVKLKSTRYFTVFYFGFP